MESWILFCRLHRRNSVLWPIKYTFTIYEVHIMYMHLDVIVNLKINGGESQKRVLNDDFGGVVSRYLWCLPGMYFFAMVVEKAIDATSPVIECFCSGPHVCVRICLCNTLGTYGMRFQCQKHNTNNKGTIMVYLLRRGAGAFYIADVAVEKKKSNGRCHWFFFPIFRPMCTLLNPFIGNTHGRYAIFSREM